jgi:hypothetical protein
VTDGDPAARGLPPAIFLMGTIGAGKTTLGRALARTLGGGHVEGDDFQQPPKPWFATSLSTSRGVLGAVLALAAQGRPAVVSYPLRCREWIFFRGRLAKLGIGAAFVSLVAAREAILAPARGRIFTAAERRRIVEMLDQGYGDRRFADLVVRTDLGTADEALAQLAGGLERLGFLRSPFDHSTGDGAGSGSGSGSGKCQTIRPL